MQKIFVTRKIPERGIQLLSEKGFSVSVSPFDRVLSKNEIIEMGKDADALLCLLTDKIDGVVLDGIGKQLKIVANYAVGFDNLDLKALGERGILATNTPGVLTDTVAEHAFSLILAIAHRISESDRFTRAGKYIGWQPLLLLGQDVSRKTLGILGLGRIGSRVAHHAVRGFDMRVLYYDVKRNEEFEKEFGAVFTSTPEELLKKSDFVSVHVPLLPTTRHLINAERLSMMKSTAYIVNTSRGPVIDEVALVDALKRGIIRGAALDVFENEPVLAPGLSELENVILTPHTASATEETRAKMSALAAENIIAFFEGKTPPNIIKTP
ncbi:MAG: D-glycerate dehydrogenase [Patescibacteria group bacterium]